MRGKARSMSLIGGVTALSAVPQAGTAPRRGATLLLGYNNAQSFQERYSAAIVVVNASRRHFVTSSPRERPLQGLRLISGIWHHRESYRYIFALALTLLCSIPGWAQQTTCFAALQGGDGPLAKILGDDPDVVISRVQAILGAESPPRDPSRARPFAMLADPYAIRGDDTSARDAALSGACGAHGERRGTAATPAEPRKHLLSGGDWTDREGGRGK